MIRNDDHDCDCDDDNDHIKPALNISQQTIAVVNTIAYFIDSSTLEKGFNERPLNDTGYNKMRTKLN